MWSFYSLFNEYLVKSIIVFIIAIMYNNNRICESWWFCMSSNHGQLSKDDIIGEISKNKTNKKEGIGIDIGRFTNHIRNDHLKFASYDITPSVVAISSKVGMLEKVYSNKSSIINSYYIYVKPKDTVLIVSNEFITIPNYIAGYVTSRVSNVANGFGHISTSVDPTWSGALLIALSNPSNRAIKIDVGISTTYHANGKLDFVRTPQTLATVTFHYLNQPYVNKPIEYKNMRSDLLEQIRYNNRNGFKAYLRKLFFQKRKHFTDHFFEYIKSHELELSTRKGWNRFINEFSIVVEEKRLIEKHNLIKKCAHDFVIKENVFNRIKHFLINHKTGVITAFIFLFTSTLLVLFITGVIDKETVDSIFDWYKRFR